ncbi:hypothetical protein ACEPAG_7414 [Sanghuangporus baumii]
MLEQYSLPSPLPQLDMYHRLQVGSNPMHCIRQNPSQPIPSFSHDSPSVTNSGQTKETLENISCTLDAGAEQEMHNDRKCPDEAFVTRKVKENGMFEDKETVASTEAGVSNKVDAPTILGGGMKGQSRAYKDRGSLSGRASKLASNRARQELLLIDELRNKAKQMKKDLLRRFKKGKKTVLNKPRTKSVRKQVPKEIAKGAEDDQHICTYPNCSFATLRKAHLNRHISTHYPDAYFCPVCHATFGREVGLNRHLSHSVVPSKEDKVSQNGDREVQKYDADIVPCIESDEALRYEVGRDPERFNFYYLGVMEDYEMDDEHFEALAKRKRKNE